MAPPTLDPYHGWIHFRWVVFSQAFISNTGLTGRFGSSSALHVSVWHRCNPIRASGFRNGEAQAARRQLPPKCLGWGASSSSLSLCQSTVLNLPEKQHSCHCAPLILSSSLKTWKWPPANCSHSANLVFHRALIKKLILAMLVTAQEMNSSVLAHVTF